MIIFVYKGKYYFYGWRVDFCTAVQMEIFWIYFQDICYIYGRDGFCDVLLQYLHYSQRPWSSHSSSCVSKPLSFLRCSIGALCLRQAMLQKKGKSNCFLCALILVTFFKKHFNDVGGRLLIIHPLEFLSQEIKCYSIKASVSFSTAYVSLEIKKKKSLFLTVYGSGVRANLTGAEEDLESSWFDQ